jgi:serine-type D-Ala-D-Ala carboxypeptidase (penicillin-binding protein 5/6)
VRAKATGWLTVAAAAALLALGVPAAVAAGAPNGSGRSAAVSPPALDVRAAAIIEASTGQALYGRDSGGELAIASATKIMTALVTLQHTRLSQVFADPVFYPAAVDSQIGLAPGERMTVHDLLIALLLPSADDAAEDLASGVGHGSVSRFVALMNAEAARLGLHHTHYSTPIGLDTPGNYSSASDLVALTRYVMSTQPFFRHVVALPAATIQMGSSRRVVTNLNTLVGHVSWVNGVKTGHTLDAGYVLVGSGTRDGMTLISAVLGAPSESARESDTLALLEYGFAAFRLVTPVKAGAVLARPPVNGSSSQTTPLVAASTFSHVFPRATRVRVLVAVPKQLTGPLRAGAVVGSAVVLAAGRRVVRIPLRLLHAVPAPPAGMLAGLGPGGVTLLLLGLLLIVGGLLRMRRRERRRPRPEPSRRPA